MNTGESGQELPVNPAIAAEIEDLLNSAGDEKTEEQKKKEFADSPIGCWQAAIIEIAPMIALISPDLALTVHKDAQGNTIDEVEALANGLAPALAKHFPSMKGFSMPVEFVAVYTVYMVFSPKIAVIRDKRAKAKSENNVKEVQPDESTST